MLNTTGGINAIMRRDLIFESSKEDVYILLSDFIFRVFYREQEMDVFRLVKRELGNQGALSIRPKIPV